LTYIKARSTVQPNITLCQCALNNPSRDFAGMIGRSQEACMSYKTIALHLALNDRMQGRLALTCKLAKRFEAHVTGIYADFLLPQPSLYTYGEVVDFSADFVKYRSENASSVEVIFNGEMAANALSGEWLKVELDPVRGVAELARCADLLVIGQHDAKNKQFYPGYHFPQSMLMSAGIPILMIPYAGTVTSLGETIVVAWDGSRESSRALHDAMPFLKRARRVTVMTVNAESEDNLNNSCSGTDVIEMLSRHAVIATLHAIEGVKGGDIGNVLLSAINDQSADLLVMGGYGHSRLHEIILGGATKTILQTATVPVLLSH
jgi:nucleotide-binding universal stress UspA family protein